MAVMVRVDDYPGTKPGEFWKHNLESFKKFHEILPKRYLLGVIPKHVSDDDLAWLGQQEKIEIGMHGINHDERFQNEFPDYFTQRDIETSIQTHREGLEFISKRHVRVYMPPHNVIDEKTCRALKSLGFAAYTTGPETKNDLAVIKRLHSEPPLEYGRSDELLERGSVAHLNEQVMTSNRVIYLTLHFPWEVNIGLDSLKSYISQIEHLIVDFDVA